MTVYPEADGIARQIFRFSQIRLGDQSLGTRAEIKAMIARSAPRSQPEKLAKLKQLWREEGLEGRVKVMARLYTDMIRELLTPPQHCDDFI